MFQTNIKHVLTTVAAGLMASAALAVTSGEKPSKAEVELHRHIANTMSQTVRTSEKDTLGRFALPKPFSVPCIRGGFQDMFYWDTYFTNAGLLLDGDVWQSRNNIEDIAAMVERFGYMPNAPLMRYTIKPKSIWQKSNRSEAYVLQKNLSPK